MSFEVFREMAAHEGRHWWFVGRRAVLSALLEKLELGPGATILEAGCGSGGNLYLLKGLGSTAAFDPSPDARHFAQANHASVEIRHGELPHLLPYELDAFDLVAALDVLEHVEDDRAALNALVSMARPGGAIIVTVPAHQVLWGAHDIRLSHRRRYGARQLRQLCESTGATITYETAFNTFLSPIAAALRLAENIPGVSIGNQERLPPRILNSLLSAVFSAERHVIARSRLPVGLSLAVILRRPERD